MQWDEVRTELVRFSRERPTLLDRSLDALASPASPPIAHVGLELLDETLALETLGDLVEAREVEDVLQECMPRPERRAFLGWLSKAILAAAAQTPVRATAAAPKTSKSLAAPARAVAAAARETIERLDQAGLGFLLDRPGRLETLPGRPLLGRLRDLLDSSTQIAIPPNARLTREELQRAVMTSLASDEKELLPLALARRAYERRRTPVVPDALQQVAKKLERAIDVRSEGLRPAERPQLAFQHPNINIRFSPLPPRLVLLADHPHSLALGSEVFDIEAPRWLPAGDRVPYEVAVLTAARDALLDPECVAVSEATRYFATPSWQHAMDSFREKVVLRAPSASEVAEDRLALRFDPAHPRFPEVLVQSRRKGGGFTPGRQTEPSTLLARPGLTADERALLTELERGRTFGAATERGAHSLERLLDLASRHPVVLFTGQSEPIQVARVRLALVVLASQDGYSFSLRIDGTPISMRTSDIALGSVVIHAEVARARLLYGGVDVRTASLLEALAEYDAVSLPSEALDEVLASLTADPLLSVDLDLPAAVEGRGVVANARPHVRLAPLAGGGLEISVHVRPLERGHWLEPGAPPERLFGTNERRERVHTVRSLDAELANAEALMATLPLGGSERVGPWKVRVTDLDRALDVVAALFEEPDRAVVEWPAGLKVRGTIRRSTLSLKVGRARDWFGLQGTATVDGSSVDLAAMLAAVRAGHGWVRLASGEVAIIERELHARLTAAADTLRDRKGALELRAPGADAIASLVDDEETQIDAAREWRALRKRMRDAGQLEPRVPADLHAELRPYQVSGYEWLARLAACGLGACLADDMGLGKTLQALALLLERREQGPALVVAPTSVCDNWEREAARFAPGLEIVVYRGPNRQALLERVTERRRVLVCSYDLLVRDQEALSKITFSTLVFDEAHAMKNAQSKRAAAARGLSADFRVALTGTPVENHVGELWSLFEVILPGLFGSWDDFKTRFANPIERNRDVARRDALAALVKPYLLRRTKAEVSPDLPPRTELVRIVDLSAAERALYELERSSAVALLRGAETPEARFAVFAALTRLRQLASHPRLRDPSSNVASSKLEAVLELILELREGGHRALVFSQFTTHLGLVREALADRDVTLAYLDGSTPPAERTRIVERFQAGEGDIFLISLKAGGVGLNLTGADFVIHLDPWWNPAAEDQASDRAHRIGQDKPVTIVRMISRGTIEETVLELHSEKRELASAILSGGDAAAKLSARELVALIERGAAEDD